MWGDGSEEMEARAPAAERAMRGRIILWCDACERYVEMDGAFGGACPECGGVMNRFRCTRCDHKWRPRKSKGLQLPDVCPKCKSPYWNRMRIRKSKNDDISKEAEE